MMEYSLDGAAITYPLADPEKSISNKLSTYFEEDTKTLVIIWEGAVSSYELRHGYARIMELVRIHKPVKWLLDLDKRDAIRRTDQRWVFTHFFPEALRMVQQDIFVAIILPVHAFPGIVSELEGDELIHGDNFLIMDHFLYKEEARRWLANRKEVKAGA